MSYNIGDQVLCINDTNWKTGLPNYPKCGDLYTIRDIIEYSNSKSGPTLHVGFLLEEVRNPIMAPFIIETSFLAHRFIKFNPEEIEDELLEELLVQQVEKMLDRGDTKKLEELLERI